MSVRENFADIFLRGMRDRRMRSGTELAREIQLTDWSIAGNLSYRSSGVQIPRDICTRFGRYLYSTKCSWLIMLAYLHIVNDILCSTYFHSCKIDVWAEMFPLSEKVPAVRLLISSFFFFIRDPGVWQLCHWSHWIDLRLLESSCLLQLKNCVSLWSFK